MCDVFLCFVTFRYGVLGQVWYLIVSIPDIWHLPYFQDRLLNDLFSDSTSVLVNLISKDANPVFYLPTEADSFTELANAFQMIFLGEGAVGLSANIPVLSFFSIIIFVTQLETI